MPKLKYINKAIANGKMILPIDGETCFDENAIADVSQECFDYLKGTQSFSSAEEADSPAEFDKQEALSKLDDLSLEELQQLCLESGLGKYAKLKNIDTLRQLLKNQLTK